MQRTTQREILLSWEKKFPFVVFGIITLPLGESISHGSVCVDSCPFLPLFPKQNEVEGTGKERVKSHHTAITKTSKYCQVRERRS